MHLAAHKRGTQTPHDAAGNQTNVISSRQDTSYFVASHFAMLDDGNTDLFIRGSKLYDKNNIQEWWQPKASFPPATENAFLYLTLGGGEGRDFPHPFMRSDSEQRLSTYETLSLLLYRFKSLSASTSVGVQNPAALHRDGNILEALVSVAMEVASHQNGVSGIPITDFLRLLTMELLLEYKDIPWNIGFDPSAYLDSELLSHLVPYLSSANDPWPDSIKGITGSYFATLQRPPDSSRIDLNVIECGITGEAKNYENGVNLKTLRDILKRVPAHSWLHLVFCSSLQKTYFTAQAKQTWSDFQKECDNLSGVCLLKMHISVNKTLSLFPLLSQTDNTLQYSRAIVFFPIEQLLR
jgi:hypothetical protein